MPASSRTSPQAVVPARWKLVLAAWALLALFSTSQALLSALLNGASPTLWKIALRGALDATVWALFAPVVFRLVRLFPIRRGSLRVSLPAHLLAGSTLALVSVGINWIARQVVGSPAMPLAMYVGLWFHRQLQWYLTLVAARYALDYFHEREARGAQLEAQLARARLEVLRTQIHPHFLFNVLNTIAEVVHHDVDLADRLMAELGELLRLAYDHPSGDLVPLDTEMRFVRAYARLQQVRYEDRLSVEVHVDEEARGAQVPNFILQPLVENAIRHGIVPSRGRGEVEVRAERAGDRLRVRVVDNGAGLKPRAPGARTGLGLENVAARLGQLYGGDHRFELRDGDRGGVEVCLEIPFRIAESREDAQETAGAALRRPSA
ncbi:MAG TPA: histidine kinase [Longimicrobiaceae bacterium]|nr:histidine kinase [Longimicrobiaceae bacterium]